MTTTTRPRTSLRAHTVASHPASRAHRRHVIAWALAHGHAVNRDALTVIIALRCDASSGAVNTAWQVDDIARTVELDAPRWCAHHGAVPPSELGLTLGSYLRYLSAHRMLPPNGARISELRREVSELHKSSSRSRHPSGRTVAAPVVPIC